MQWSCWWYLVRFTTTCTNNYRRIPNKLCHRHGTNRHYGEDYKYSTTNRQHNRYRWHRAHRVIRAQHYPDTRDYHHRTNPCRTRFPKISNTLRLCQHLAPRGRHSSHYYQQYCHIEVASSGMLELLHYDVHTHQQSRSGQKGTPSLRRAFIVGY